MPTILATVEDAFAWLAARVDRRAGARLVIDSRRLRAGDGFIAWPGHATDGRRHVHAALDNGAVACLVEAQGVAAYGLDDPRVAALPGLKSASGAIADAWFDAPSAALAVVACTGTNGKTSSAWWTAQALNALGRRCGLVGTLGIGEPPSVTVAGGGPERVTLVATGLTTPDPLTLHGALRDFADRGFAACAIEASSIGVVEHRLDALRIRVALFTNFTRDHLDFHGDMDAYWAAKRALFAWPGLGAAVVNIDDAQGRALAGELTGGGVEVWTVSMTCPARLRALGLAYVDGGLGFDVLEDGQCLAVRSTLVGDFNASNLLGVLGVLRALGVSLAEAVATVAALTPVPGRLQRLPAHDLDVVVDYAHTPDALEKVLRTLRPLARARGGRLWCVFGCGGNRDATKRPLMGAIAARDADHVVLTSDNPRDESPAVILAHILAGVAGRDEVDVIEDRRQAIQGAIAGAAPGDVVLLAGKGHEDYQEVAGRRLPFSDVDEARAALALREAAR